MMSPFVLIYLREGKLLPEEEFEWGHKHFSTELSNVLEKKLASAAQRYVHTISLPL